MAHNYTMAPCHTTLPSHIKVCMDATKKATRFPQRGESSAFRSEQAACVDHWSFVMTVTLVGEKEGEHVVDVARRTEEFGNCLFSHPRFPLRIAVDSQNN